MNKIKYRLMLVLFGISLFRLQAQIALSDGVTATQSFINEIIKNYNDENSYPFDLEAIPISVGIPIRVHIIKNINGLNGVALTDVYQSISVANGYFKNIGIQFFVDSVNYVNDYNYACITNNHLKTELLTRFMAANRINLFLADSVKLGAARSYGYTYFPDTPDSNLIFLDKKYAAGKYVTTLLGHFMGLLSTHETRGGAELVSGKNCATSGDFICDTYADPDLYDQVDSTCTYTGTSMDSNGKYFVPSVANIMSNTTDHCKCIFTPLQYRRMYYYFLKYRQYLKH